ncbi:MAG: glycosyltransferase family 2 protein [Flavitalea sp.]
MVSIIILTKNEENDIRGCLESIKWCDDVHVLDSGSTDKTIEISTELGAKISFNKFRSFGDQRNWALDNIETKYDWILFLDADERTTDKYTTALFDAIRKAGPDVAGFYCCWKMILDGKWIRFCDNFRKWQFRVLLRGKARFKDFGHGQKEDIISGEAQYLMEPYLHYGFSKGWAQWIDRHNRYSTEEAISRSKVRPPFSQVFSKHGSLRNVAIKSWMSRFPGWPLIRFVYTYFLRLGFVEGRQGFTYCVNICYYEFLIQIKMREIRRQQQLNGAIA